MRAPSRVERDTEAMQQPSGSPVRIRHFPPEEPWILESGRLTLVAGQCESCSAICFPAVDVCSKCGTSGKQRSLPLPSTGRLYSFSEVHAGPRGYPSVYVVGYVDFENGVRVFGQIDTKAERLRIDDQLYLVLGQIRTDPDGGVVLSYKFRKLD